MEIKKIIELGEFGELNDYVGSDLFTELISLGSFEAIEYLYNRNKDKNENLNQHLLDGIVDSCIDRALSECARKSMDLIRANNTIPLEFNDDREQIRTLCKMPGNIELFRFLLEIRIYDIWPALLIYACLFAEEEIIWFVIINFPLDKEVIDDAFDSLVGNEVSGHGNNDPHYESLIKYFIMNLNANINLENENEWESVYLDCLLNFPRAAKYFYRDVFDSSIINNLEFWEVIVEIISSQEYLIGLYKEAFEDLKREDIDLSGVKKIFQELDEEELFIEYFEF